jgi:YHS domain-containing protein
VPASAVDPVCGMRVDVATARHTAEVGGVVYYFCCASCRARFVKQPQDDRP